MVEFPMDAAECVFQLDLFFEPSPLQSRSTIVVGKTWTEGEGQRFLAS